MKQITDGKHDAKIASELKLTVCQVDATARLLDDDATVPFIARYRKEITGGLDEISITAIRDRLQQLRALEKRRESILGSMDESGKLTDMLKARVLAAETLAELEDIYLPYRPKRRTRGMAAKEKGLEPLALKLFEQGEAEPVAEATPFVKPEKGVESIEDALAGARDIVAEWINESAEARAELRRLFTRNATFRTRMVKGKAAEGGKYKDYADWEEPVSTAPSHRILAMLRGANEGFLTLHILPNAGAALAILERRFLKGEGSTAEQIRMAISDGYRRLLSLSLETEIRQVSKTRADKEAIKVFAENLRNLLLASPLGQKAVLSIDPGLRTGCKVVCLDPQGKLLGADTIFPLEPHNRTEESAEKLKALADSYAIQAIAVGNGTGGREAHEFCQGLDFGRQVPVVMVNESGASIYSASEAAREEFPDADVTVRGAVSIGRRLIDPLAELVKIDPKSIGVGQYQHDVEQKALKNALDDVVVSCVNAVGVEINTASKQLVSHISGVSERLAEKLIAYRIENGAFRSKSDVMKIPGMGAKTFEQAAGFLRIQGAENPLDASGVHPESYSVVEAMASDLGCILADLMGKPELRKQISLEKYVTETAGMPTLTDIMAELAKPGRDPREPFNLFTFTQGVNEISDLAVGMKLTGVVTNVTAFGAFVDIGVHRDGLVHISELADKYVRNPHDVVKVNQKVLVTVLNIDKARERISLSMRNKPIKPRETTEKSVLSSLSKRGSSDLSV